MLAECVKSAVAPRGGPSPVFPPPISKFGKGAGPRRRFWFTTCAFCVFVLFATRKMRCWFDAKDLLFGIRGWYNRNFSKKCDRNAHKCSRIFTYLPCLVFILKFLGGAFYLTCRNFTFDVRNFPERVCFELFPKSIYIYMYCVTSNIEVGNDLIYYSERVKWFLLCTYRLLRLRVLTISITTNGT